MHMAQRMRFCERRYFVREQNETQVSQVELFLNSVPILGSLSRDERLRIVDALEEIVYQQGQKVGQLAQRWQRSWRRGQR